MYIGNEAEYAGFAVNNPGATAPVGNPDGVTYDEHEQIIDNITPPSGIQIGIKFIWEINITTMLLH